MYTTRRIAIAAMLLTVFTTAVMAQSDTPEYNEQVIVTGSYRPEIDEATKINIPPVMADTSSTLQHRFTYTVSPRRLNSLYEPARIKAARIVGEPTTKLYNNYFRLGFGNYWSPLAEAYYNSLRDKKLTYGAALQHRSSWDKLPSVGPNHYSMTTLSAFGKYILNGKLQISSDIAFTNDHNLYYGFTDSTLQAVLGRQRSDIKLADYTSNFNYLCWNAGVKNLELDKGRFGYAANMRLANLWASYGQTELQLNLTGDVNYGFIVMNKYKGVAFLHIDWDAYANAFKPDANGTMPLGYSGAAPDTVKHSRNILKINPYADFMFSGLHFHAGLTTGWDAFTSNNVVFRVFPDVVVSKSFMGENLVLSVGATGGIDANSWHTMSLINPYIAPGSELRATRHYDFVAYGRWSMSKKLEVKANIEYALLRDDMSFALNGDYGLHNVFSPYYFDDNRLKMGADVAFVNDEMIKLELGGNYYNYKVVGTGQYLLYRPDFDLHFNLDLNYNYKWFGHLGLALLGKMDDELAGQTMPLRYGINAEVEYRHNRALSFFLKADNMAFQRYMLWANYPSQRAIFIVGLSYTLPK
ncbi:MAG: hypothetical protein K5650_03135 [Bacteroidales bacterium]|nr:hypothetical protein [Bacteroidales bacterium]